MQPMRSGSILNFFELARSQRSADLQSCKAAGYFADFLYPVTKIGVASTAAHKLQVVDNNKSEPVLVCFPSGFGA